MAFRSVMKLFSKEEGFVSTLQKTQLGTDSYLKIDVEMLMKIYEQARQSEKQDELIKYLTGCLEKRKNIAARTKITIYLLHISKVTSYDIPEMLMEKKLKVFCEESVKKKIGHTFELTNGNKEDYIHKYVLIPVHNYMNKLAINEELYHTCVRGEVPNDELYRRGSKIRYVWVFKIYNLLNLLFPMLDPLLRLIAKYPADSLFQELLLYCWADITYYINFITKCIEQTLTLSNPLLLPYADCLQFFQSLKQYRMLRSKLQPVTSSMKKQLGTAFKPITLYEVQQEVFKQMEMLAVRIQLISCSLRNNNSKQNERLATEYYQKVQNFQMRAYTDNDEP